MDKNKTITLFIQCLVDSMYPEVGQAMVQLFEKLGISVNIPLEMSSNRAIKKAVEGGLGVALISRKVADEEIERGELVAIPLSDQSITRKFYMVHHRDKYISELLQGFINQVDRWASDYMETVS